MSKILKLLKNLISKIFGNKEHDYSKGAQLLTGKLCEKCWDVGCKNVDKCK